MLVIIIGDVMYLHVSTVHVHTRMHVYASSCVVQ